MLRSPGIAGMATFILCVALCLGQDTVKLKDGSTLLGDVVSETEGSVELVTPNAELRRLVKADVEAIARGKPMSSRVTERLAKIDPSDANALAGLAEWAAKDSFLASDGKRLARRIVARNPDHAAARAVLGHVKVDGVWYAGKSAADQAVISVMTKEGRVRIDDGWALKADVAAIRAAPKDWMVDPDRRWRTVVEVMTSRGLLAWGGEWYTSDFQPEIDVARRLKEALGLQLSIARSGGSVAFTTRSRAEAQKLADFQQKCRQWFGRTFGPKAEDLVLTPIARLIAVPHDADMHRFIAECGDIHGLRPGTRRSEGLAGIGFKELCNLYSEERDTSPQPMIADDMGSRSLFLLTSTHGRAPYWLHRAAGLHCEIATLGEARVLLKAQDRYARGGDVHGPEGATLASVRALLRGSRRAGDLMHMETLFRSKIDQLTSEHDTMSIAAMAFFLETRKDKFLSWLTESHRDDIAVTVKRSLGETFEELDTAFRGWL